MVNTDTFLTALYVMVDDFLKVEPAPPRPGPAASLSPSEIVTLAVFAQWRDFASERDFYRWAANHLRPAFPSLPDRTQFNRLARAHARDTARFACFVAEQLGASHALYQAVDGTAMPVRFYKRRRSGWLAGQANIGWSNRLGWYCGFHVLTCVTPEGVIAGYGVAAASTNERPMIETLLAARLERPRGLESVGERACGPLVADKGFAGACQKRWREAYGAEVIAPPQKVTTKNGPKQKWSKRVRRMVSSIRQIVETVNNALHNSFRLGGERPHALSGALTRVAAKVALHNFCIWLNRQLNRRPLEFADLIDW